jgi:hypothetical protein
MMLYFSLQENILGLGQCLPQKVCENTKSIEYLTRALMAVVINSSLDEKVTALKTTNGSRGVYLKIARSLIIGMSLGVTGQALHDTFLPGFNFSPRFNGRTMHLFFFWLMLKGEASL